MATATMTSKGQVTVPREVRTRLGLRAGDRLEFEFDESGRLFLEAKKESPLGRLPGLLQHLAKDRPVTIEEMNQAIRERAVEKWRRAQRR